MVCVCGVCVCVCAHAGPAQSGILTDREVVSLFLHFTVNPKPRVEFIDRPRCCLRGKECSITRFAQVESRWGYSGTSDRIRYTHTHTHTHTRSPPVFARGRISVCSLQTSHMVGMVTQSLLHVFIFAFYSSVCVQERHLTPIWG